MKKTPSQNHRHPRIGGRSRLRDLGTHRRARGTGQAGEESLRIEREKYDLGKGTIIDVLDAQSALLDAQTNYYRALADLHISRASLALATGVEP